MRRLSAAFLLVLLISGAVEARDTRGPQLGANQVFSDSLVGRRLALCIGIDGYGGTTYGRLRYAAADAKAFAHTFEALGYEVTLLVDDPEGPAESQPTYRNLDDVLHRLCRASASASDTLIITFSGHGDVIGGQSVLLPLDYHEEERALTVGALFDALARAKASKRLIVLDACRSAARDDARTLQSGFLESLGHSKQAVVISGCGADQYAVEDDTLQHGRLTKTLIDGLTGEAFGEGREFLFGHELWGYVERVFHEQGWAAAQSPKMFGVWDARVRFDIARRDVEPPPPITDADRAVFDLTMKAGLEKMAAHDMPASIDYARTALRILPKHPDALALMGAAYASLGYFDKAFQHAQLAAEQDPANVFALLVHCLCEAERGNTDTFLVQAARLVFLFGARPAYWTARLPPALAANMWLAYGFGLMLVSAPLEKQLAALAEVDKIPEAFTDTRAFAHWVEGSVYMIQRRPEAALEAYEKGLELLTAAGMTANDTWAWQLWGRAQAYNALGRQDDVRADCEAILEVEGALDLVRGNALVHLGDLDSRAGRIEEAEAFYRRALALEEASTDSAASAAISTARLLVRRGATVEALALYTRAASLEGAPPERTVWALAERGWLHRTEGRLDAARRDLDAADRIRRRVSLAARASVGTQRALTFESLGLVDDALDTYRGVHDMEGAAPADVGHALIRKAMLLRRLDRAEQAAPLFERVIGIQGVHPDWLLLARIGRGSESDLDEAMATTGASAAGLALGYLELLRVRDAEAPPAVEAQIAEPWRVVIRHIAHEDWEACDAAFEKALESPGLSRGMLGFLTELGTWAAVDPETRVLLAWVRHYGAAAEGARGYLRRYLEAHPEGALASRAKALLAEIGGD